MSEAEILENNKAIAEFMGYIQKEIPANEVYEHTICSSSQAAYDRIIFENPNDSVDYKHFLEYHTSWDWLMPVVEKIEGMIYDINISRTNCAIVLVFTDDEFKAIEKEADTKLSATYQAVCEFIKQNNHE